MAVRRAGSWSCVFLVMMAVVASTGSAQSDETTFSPVHLQQIADTDFYTLVYKEGNECKRLMITPSFQVIDIDQTMPVIVTDDGAIQLIGEPRVHFTTATAEELRAQKCR